MEEEIRRSTFKTVTDPGRHLVCEHLPAAEVFNRRGLDGDSFGMAALYQICTLPLIHLWYCSQTPYLLSSLDKFQIAVSYCHFP